uniref:Uncharacterized protein n=1 Tax=Arundo donax TaxID=35708 RepID=A0A0A9G8D2_ARUDO
MNQRRSMDIHWRSMSIPIDEIFHSHYQYDEIYDITMPLHV